MNDNELYLFNLMVNPLKIKKKIVQRNNSLDNLNRYLNLHFKEYNIDKILMNNILNLIQNYLEQQEIKKIVNNLILIIEQNII
jgi:hypothetical protein